MLSSFFKEGTWVKAWRIMDVAFGFAILESAENSLANV